MTVRSLLAIPGIVSLALALACGGGGSNSLARPVTDTGTVGFLVQDATSETWSSVNVIIRKASLVLASDKEAANPVEIYDGSQDATPVNLLQLDTLQELLGQVDGVPAGTYDHLLLEVDGQPSDITLVPAPDAASGAATQAIPASQIIVNGKHDPSNPTWMVLPSIKLSQDLVVTQGSAGAVAVDFDLSSPAFIVEHDTTSATPLYVVDFGASGVFRHAPAAALDAHYLHHHRGTVASVASDASSFTLTTDHGKTFTIHAGSAAVPTCFYDLDQAPVSALSSNNVPSTLVPGLDVACSARYQDDGSLVAVRVWYTAAAGTLPSWTPEGHVAKVDAANGILYVLDPSGNAVPYTISQTTRWFWKGDPSTDISGGQGLAFLPNVDRYFKVHVTVADPSATPLAAASVDIQRAFAEGTLTSADASGFSYARTWGDGTVSRHALGFSGTFSFWDFTFPSSASSDLTAFQAEATSGIILDTSEQEYLPFGESSLGYAGGSEVWDAQDLIFMPTAISSHAQDVVVAYAGGAMTVKAKDKGAVGVAVTLDATPGDQPLVTLYARSGSAVAVTPLDSTQWAKNLTKGAEVRVYGVPDGKGHLKAYYINIYE
jgi:hypothetical protein